MEKMRKFVIGFLSIAFSLSLGLGFASCAKEKEDRPSVDYIIPDYNLTVPQSIAMTLGDETTIVPVYDEREGINLTFISADPSIVSVTAQGELSAMKVGSTSITVRYGEKSVQTSVSVSLSDKLPRLQYLEDFEKGVNIAYNDTYSFFPEVYFNGKTFADAEATYSLEDPTIGSFDAAGVFTPSKKGSTTLTIQATWRGVTCDDMTAIVRLNVVDAVDLFVNDGAKDSFTLYTLKSFGGEDFETETPFNVTAKVNGESVVPTIEILSGADTITYKNDEITAVKEGEAKIKVTIQTEGGAVTRIYDVSVVLPTLEYEQTLDFSAADGELPVEELFWSGAEIVKAYQGDRVLTVENNQVLGVTPNILGGISDPNVDPDDIRLGETKIVVYTEKAARVLTLKAYTKLIDEASDLYDLALSSQNELVDNGLINGYFGLACDVVCDETFVPTSHEDSLMDNADGGFYGVFNGNGYQLKVPTYKKGGLFGRIGRAYICNLSVTFNEQEEGDSETAGFAYALGNGKWSRRTVFENVEIVYNGLGKATENGNASFVLANRAPAWFTLRNTVIWIDQATTGRSAALLAAGSDFGFDANNNSFINVFENTYVVTESDLPMLESSRAKCWAQNDQKTENVYLNLFRAKNTKHLSSSEIYRENVEYASFTSSTVWEVRNGIPTWKGKSPAEYAQILMDGVALNQFTSLQDGDKGAITLFVGSEQLTNWTYNVQSATQSVAVSQNGELTAMARGEAVLEVLYGLDGENQTKTYQIVVTLPIKNLEIKEFSAYDGTIDWSFIGNEEIISVKQGTTVLTADKENGTLKGVVPNITAGSNTGEAAFSNADANPQDRKVSPVTVTVETSGGLYYLEITAYTRVITTVEQLSTFNLSNTDTDFLKTASDGVRTIDGYFLLGNDITSDSFVNAHEYVGETSWSTTTHGFRGVFDGNGHTITVSSSAKGLFGAMTRAYVKNAKFVFTETATSGSIGLVRWMPAEFYSRRCYMEDVTITVNGFGASNTNGTNSAAIAYGLGNNITFANVTVNVNYAMGVATNKTTGILANYLRGNPSDLAITVVESEKSNAPLIYSKSVSTGKEIFYWASNDGKTANDANKVLASAIRRVK